MEARQIGYTAAAQKHEIHEDIAHIWQNFWQMLPNEETVCGTSSLPVLWHHMCMFAKSEIAELSGATIVRSWEVTGILHDAHAQETSPICCKTVCEDCRLNHNVQCSWN